MLGKNVIMDGKIAQAITTISMDKIKGAAPLVTLTKGSFMTELATKRFTPNGGVTIPTINVRQNTMPTTSGSIPICVPMGTKIGARITIAIKVLHKGSNDQHDQAQNDQIGALALDKGDHCIRNTLGDLFKGQFPAKKIGHPND